MDLIQNMSISAAGMQAENARIRAAAENIANADSVQRANGQGPYRAKVVSFQTVLDRQTGANTVRATTKEDTQTPLRAVYQPSSNLADGNGFVQYPNVDITTENLNMREAQRSYEANMSALTISKDMAIRTLDMIK